MLHADRLLSLAREARERAEEVLARAENFHDATPRKRCGQQPVDRCGTVKSRHSSARSRQYCGPCIDLPGLPAPSLGPTRISPPRACLIKLVASSVATSAARPASTSLKPCCLAMAVTSRRASPTRLSSLTLTRTNPPALNLVDPLSVRSSRFPTRDGDLGAGSKSRFDAKFVCKPPRSPEPEAQARSRCETVLQCSLNVRNAWTSIFESQPNAKPANILRGLAPVLAPLIFQTSAL
jgi:hypothetical protein